MVLVLAMGDGDGGGDGKDEPRAWERQRRRRLPGTGATRVLDFFLSIFFFLQLDDLYTLYFRKQLLYLHAKNAYT